MARSGPELRCRLRSEHTLWLLATAALVVGACAAYLVPAIARTGGAWPAPLDDVYIHFGFARSAALGHPFEWVPGNGYSSGSTSLTYPLLLAPAYLIGLRGASLGMFASALACACLLDLACSVRRLIAAATPRAPGWVVWVAPALLLSVPVLDWSFFSNMEVALVAGLIGRTLVAADDAVRAPPMRRARAQLSAGLWGALLFATRPETLALVGPVAILVTHGAGSLRTLPSLARALGPAAAFGALQACLNRVLTSEWSAAGAVRKLVWSNPYGTPLEHALEVIKNLAALRVQGLGSALGGEPWAWALPALAALAVASPQTRRPAIALSIGAVAALGLVSLNTTARFQNLRYLAPTLTMLLVAAALGAAALAARGRPGRAAAALLVLAAGWGSARWFPRQIDHFARASANITDQQVEVARRIGAMRPAARRVFVGDAGAIPYFSGVAALDGLGLGGYHDLPFARASVHGVPAVLELLERVAVDERPDLLAVYPSWWPGLADRFGRRIDSVLITDNVICAADEKVIYAADWSALAVAAERPGAVDALDVADLVDERAHEYSPPVPRGGWAIGFVLDDPRTGRPLFDGGRIVPEGREETFTVARAVEPGPATLVLRTDGGDAVLLEVAVSREHGGSGSSRAAGTGDEHGDAGSSREVVVAPRPPDRWSEVSVAIPSVQGGDRVSIRASRGAWRSFHAWLLRP